MSTKTLKQLERESDVATEAIVSGLASLGAGIDRLKAENADLARTLAFAASVIKSGEPWTAKREEIIGGALRRATHGAAPDTTKGETP